MASALSGFVAMRDQRAATVFGKVKILLKLQLLCYLLLAKHHLWQNLPADLKSKAIYEPFRDELFTAELKRGAFLNGPPGMLSFSVFSRKTGCFFWETLPILKGSYATTGDLFSIYLQLHPSRG